MRPVAAPGDAMSPLGWLITGMVIGGGLALAAQRRP